jgi:hypothetical protein
VCISNRCGVETTAWSRRWRGRETATAWLRRRRGRDDGVAETTAWPRRRRGRDDGVAETTAWWWCHLLRCYILLHPATSCYIVLTTINASYSPNTPTTRHHSVDADDTLLVAVTDADDATTQRLLWPMTMQANNNPPQLLAQLHSLRMPTTRRHVANNQPKLLARCLVLWPTTRRVVCRQHGAGTHGKSLAICLSSIAQANMFLGIAYGCRHDYRVQRGVATKHSSIVSSVPTINDMLFTTQYMNTRSRG